jgi:hypothetical protein
MIKLARMMSSFALLVGAAGKTLLAQCSMCQASLANSEDGAGMIGGFRQGIGMLLGVMLLLGIAGWRYARGVRSNFAIRQRGYNSESSGLVAEDSARQ